MKRTTFILALIAASVSFWWWSSHQPSSTKLSATTIALEGNPATVDPVGVTDVHSSMVATAVHSPLAWVSGDGNFVPMVASKIVMGSDAMSLTISLSPQASFWDGSAVHPSDVIYSIERYRRSANLHRWILDRVKGIKEFDEKKTEHISGLTEAAPTTVKLQFDAPEPDARLMLCNLSVGIVKAGTGELPPQPFGVQVMGCGPYIPDGFEPGLFNCRLKSKDDSKPAQLTFRVVSDDQARIQGYRSGSIDILRLRGPMISEVTTSVGGKLRARKDVPGKVSVYPANELNYLICNWSSQKLVGIAAQDRRNVLAQLSAKLDRAKLVTELYPAGSAEATASIAPPITGAKPLAALAPPSAIEPSPPRKLTLVAANDSASRQLAVAVQKQLNASGLEIDAEFVDLGKLIEKLIKKDFDLMLFWIELQVPSSGPYAWCSFFDKAAPLSAFGEARDDISAALGQARGVPDDSLRAEAFSKVVSLIDEHQQSWVPLMSRKAVVIHSESTLPAFDANGTPINGIIRKQ
ncbi:MAG: ABC transporter substrate-binding protein [Verrucomicrobiaceae bacterium]|nr:ABC transporter substrate-binding protein [Verrucomicrobiaceae bacterium]